jgi:polyisoprenyl-phosphate glycosyltransferase
VPRPAFITAYSGASPFLKCSPRAFDCFLVGRPAIDFLVSNREIHASLPGLLLWSGFPAAMVPYDRIAREEGRSGWTLAKKLKYLSTQ